MAPKKPQIAKTGSKPPAKKPPAATHRERLLAALGAVVRAQRGRLGQSRQVLSKRAALSERFLAQLESGRGNISVAKLDDLARALGVPSAALLTAASRAGRAPASDFTIESRTIESRAIENRAIENRASEKLASITRQLEQGTPELLDSVSKHLDDWRSDGGTERPGLIALLGLRGAGKSTLGPLLAERLGLDFHEMDDLIAEESGLALSDIFALHGESYYREAERRALRGLIDRRERAIVAVSGGIVTGPEAFDLLKRHTLMVWLYTSPENYMARVEAQGDYRPMRNRPNAMAELKALLTERTPLYRQAHVALDTAKLSAGAAAERLAALVAEADPRSGH